MPKCYLLYASSICSDKTSTIGIRSLLVDNEVLLMKKTDMEVQSAVHQWLRQRPASFFAQGIQKLVYRLEKCSNKFRQYVEK